MDIGLELKEVQMSPSSFYSIMHVAACFSAFRTRKFTACFEIDMDIELLSFSTKSIVVMYQGSSRFNAILNTASCEIGTANFLARVDIKT